MRQEEEVLLITLGNINPDKSLMSLLSEWKHSYLASEDPSILDKVEKWVAALIKYSLRLITPSRKRHLSTQLLKIAL